jgi:archaemetzincin
MCGTGVFSFARYHNSFDLKGKFPNYNGVDDFSEVTFRSAKVLLHEIGHLFNLKHCKYYRCLMNGSNSLEESERKPF